MDNQKKFLGALSALLTYAALFAIALHTKAFDIIKPELAALLSGNFQAIEMSQTSFLMMFPVMLAVVSIELPCNIGAGVFQSIVLGKSGKHAVAEELSNLGEGNHFFSFFIVCLIEELFARELFLGLLPKLSFLSGPVAFYVLFFIGNSIWALIHLPNYRKESDRKVLRVLPQFVAGVFFTYIFIKFGLLAAILTHFASNAVIFAFYKTQRIRPADLMIIIYSGICAWATYSLMTKPISDILPWFANNPQFKLVHWEFWDYVKVSIFISAFFKIAFGIMLYDQRDTESKPEKGKTSLLGFIFGMAIFIGISYVIYALLGFVTDSVPYRILLLAIILTFLQKGSSGSALARTFWVGLPDTYVTICIIQALGFFPAIGWAVLELLVQIPLIVLSKIKD